MVSHRVDCKFVRQFLLSSIAQLVVLHRLCFRLHSCCPILHLHHMLLSIQLVSLGSACATAILSWHTLGVQELCGELDLRFEGYLSLT